MDGLILGMTFQLTELERRNNMGFLREVPVENITDKLILSLEQEGFTLIWLKDSVEIWGDMTEEQKRAREFQLSKAA